LAPQPGILQKARPAVPSRLLSEALGKHPMEPIHIETDRLEPRVQRVDLPKRAALGWGELLLDQKIQVLVDELLPPVPILPGPGLWGGADSRGVHRGSSGRL
jgi:hypothetical protein